MDKDVVVKKVNGVQVITVENQGTVPSTTQNIPESSELPEASNNVYEFEQTPQEKRFGFTEASGWVTAAVLAGVLIATLLSIWLF